MTKVVRVAIYCRVSTEEQAKYGYSIMAQVDELNEYVKKHKEMKLVGTYIDDGVSAVKIKKRLELQRLLEDVKQGKIDLILFTKLDRWGRSVSIYYQIQDILDKYNVTWKAIHEDYEVQTASGKFKVNIMMSVAQQERDKGSERIKDVFKLKLKNKEALTGATPFGLMIKEIEGKKRIVINKEEEPILRDLIEHFKTHQSLRKTDHYARRKYEHFPRYAPFYRLLRNPQLYGHFRGVDDYCEAYMTKEEFEQLQVILDRNIKVRNTNHVYIFAKMIKCPICGNYLVGFATKGKLADGTEKYYYGYRCETHYFPKAKTCSFNVSKSQPIFEEKMLDKLQSVLANYIVHAEAEEKKAIKKVDVSKLKAELDRLNNMYLKGRISEEDYDEKYTKINDKIKSSIAEKSEFNMNEALKDLKGINVLELYKSFSIEEKQAFMRGIVKEIIIDENYNIKDIIFL